MKGFSADLHIHTCLSPCSDPEMTPKRIVERSLQEKLDIIAVCDHNSAENAGATMAAGKKQGVEVLPGMEICSREEVHIVALFEKLEEALKMQEYVYAHLTEENRPEVFGDQWVLSEDDELVGENPRLLIGAAQLSLEDIVDRIHSLHGLGVASHVDRPAFGIINQLGFIPPDLDLDGVELSRHISREEALEKIPGIGSLPCISSTDAHYLDDIGKASTTFHLAEPTVAEIRLAFRNEAGRSIEG